MKDDCLGWTDPGCVRRDSWTCSHWLSQLWVFRTGLFSSKPNPSCVILTASSVCVWPSGQGWLGRNLSSLLLKDRKSTGPPPKSPTDGLKAAEHENLPPPDCRELQVNANPPCLL